MCQLSKTKGFTILKEDMVVYKIMTPIRVDTKSGKPILHSPYQGFPFILNKIHTVTKKDIKWFITNSQTILHDIYPYAITVGFHSYINKTDAKNQANCWGRSLVKCIIPKGSSIITGIFSTGCQILETVVSNKIKVVEILM
jgi:hypothetical protein